MPTIGMSCWPASTEKVSVLLFHEMPLYGVVKGGLALPYNANSPCRVSL